MDKVERDDRLLTPFVVDVRQEFEVRYRARLLGLTTRELRDAARMLLIPDIRDIARLMNCRCSGNIQCSHKAGSRQEDMLTASMADFSAFVFSGATGMPATAYQR